MKRYFFITVLSLIVLSCEKTINYLPETELSIGEFSLGDSLELCYNESLCSSVSFVSGIQELDSAKVVWFSTEIELPNGTSVFLKDVKAYGDDVVHGMLYDMNNDEFKDGHKKILSYLESSFGPPVLIKNRWKKRNKEFGAVHKYVDYHFFWYFVNGYVHAIEHTHYMSPFKDQVVCEGITVFYGDHNTSFEHRIFSREKDPGLLFYPNLS